MYLGKYRDNRYNEFDEQNRVDPKYSMYSIILKLKRKLMSYVSRKQVCHQRHQPGYFNRRRHDDGGQDVSE